MPVAEALQAAPGVRWPGPQRRSATRSGRNLFTSPGTCEAYNWNIRSRNVSAAATPTRTIKDAASSCMSPQFLPARRPTPERKSRATTALHIYHSASGPSASPGLRWAGCGGHIADVPLRPPKEGMVDRRGLS